ncbi:MAG TPA: arylamine N-acetyltransferase [Vicinamibacterales bacterium]
MRLHDYLRRIGHAGPLDTSVETLRRLHVAHRETFLFENLSIQGGGGVSVTLGDIERKFIDQGRGGYCFEHNTLFAGALRECGFETTTLLGRVRRGPPETWRRTHMVLRVTARLKPRAPADAATRTEREASAERSWLADVGFGAISLIEPILLVDGSTNRQRGLTYTLRRDRDLWVLSMADANGAQDLYEFSDESQTEGDVEVANHYTSTHPESIFRKSLTVQGVRGNDRTILRSGVVTRYVNGVLEESPIERADLRRHARELFGVELPHDPLVFDSYADKPL